MKDILIGAVDSYGWDSIKPWAESIREVGFTGDVYLIVYRANEDFSKQAQELDITLYPVEHTPYNEPIQHHAKGSPTQAHNLRFYHAWEILTRLVNEGINYNFVCMTDVSDVIFQSDPFRWYVEWGWQNERNETKIIAPSEGILFRDEEWNKDNLIKGFGQLLWDLEAEKWEAFNVGTVIGHAAEMRELFNTIFRMTEGRYYPSDQSSWNLIIRHGGYKIHRLDMNWGYAAQMGTTHDPTKQWLWEKCNQPRPVIKNGKVYTTDDKLFAILHQWNRVPDLKKLIEEKYGL